MSPKRVPGSRWLALLAGLLGLTLPGLLAADATAVQRGAYLAAAGGCFNCHTDNTPGSPSYAGGRALETRFGTFYGTNLTPDRTHGLGTWQLEDFLRAMREGRAPDGRTYYPAFPYASFTRMTDADLSDLWAYLQGLEPVAKQNRPHRIKAAFRGAFQRSIWRRANFRPGVFRPDPARPTGWNRGAYLVTGPGHCGECHTPRNRIGGLDRSRTLAGVRGGIEGDPASNITPDEETGLGRWSLEEIVDYLQSGLTPDGDVVGGKMGEIVRNGTSHLTPEDLRAMAVYLKSIPPVKNQVGKPKEEKGSKDEDW